MQRGVPLAVHSALEMIAAPAIMVAPFVLGFGPAAAVLSVAIGAVLLGHAVQVEAPRRTVPLSAHAALDYGLAAIAAVAGIAVGVATGEWGSASFLVGVGAALACLAATTRFSARLGT